MAVVDELKQPLQQRLRLPALRLDMNFARPVFGVALLDKRAGAGLPVVEIEAVAPIFGGEPGLFADPGNQRAHQPRRQQLISERRFCVAAVVPFLAKLFFYRGVVAGGKQVGRDVLGLDVLAAAPIGEAESRIAA